VVVGEVVGVTVEEVVIGSGGRVVGGAVDVVVDGVAARVTGVGLVKFGGSTRMTSSSAPAPTDVSLRKEPPVKLSVQL
jgi:hypothetical protein